MNFLKTIASTVYLAGAFIATTYVLHAQSPHPSANRPTIVAASQADTTGKDFAGVWEGVLHTDHTPDAPLKLTFTMTPEFGVVVSISMAGHEAVDGAATELKASGVNVSWKQSIMQTSCTTTASIGEDGSLKGHIGCGHVGAVFVARKK